MKIKDKWVGTGCACLTAVLLAGMHPVLAETKASVHAVRAAGDTQRVIAVSDRSGAAGEQAAPAPVTNIHNVRLSWPEQPGAVQYQVVILRSEQDDDAGIVWTQNQVFTNGVDINLSRFGKEAGGFYWKVCALDYNGRAIGHFSKPKPITENSELNPKAPKPTTQFDQMDYAPLYPVFSWIPLNGMSHHEVMVYRAQPGGDVLIHSLRAGQYDIYEDGGFTTPGQYYWQVRATDAYGNPLSGWSEKTYFEVKNPAPVAALGDSITHGGGAMSVPPGYVLYNWETYSAVPVKNLGFSGNTTAEMLARFERDVLPSQPRILVIMGGVNDFRSAVLGWQTVQNLIAIREKCEAYGIIPVFLTATPINPALMTDRAHIDAPPSDWLVHQQYINDWIMRQRYCVDVSTMLADSEGWLRPAYTTDGLHPDYFGKKYIGERVGQYLQAHFSWVTSGLPKKPVPPYGY